MKKWILGLLSIVCLINLTGCSSSPKNKEDTIHMTVFVLETCSNCKAFKEYAIPALEKEFGNQIEITLKDLDEEENGKLYDDITSQLEGYDNVYSRLVPFIVVEDYFAVLAYNKGEEVELIKDIKAARNNEPLGEALSNGRWLFKK